MSLVSTDEIFEARGFSEVLDVLWVVRKGKVLRVKEVLFIYLRRKSR
jgi:hypothetical protein